MVTLKSYIPKTDGYKLGFDTYQRFLLPGDVGHMTEILVNNAVHYG